MGFEQHYNILNALHHEAPGLIKKVKYEIQFYVVVNHFRPKISSYMQISPLAKEFNKLTDFYEGKKFTSDVEEFHVSSEAGSNIFVAAFSNNGVDFDSSSTVLRRTSFNLFHDRMEESAHSPVGTAQCFWLTTQRWQTFNNEPANNLTDMQILSESNTVGNKFLMELLAVTPATMHPTILYHNFTSMQQVFDSFQAGELGVDFVNNIVNRHWLWNDQYFYTEFSEPYRHLMHPHLPPKTDFAPALNFNVKANSLGKNVNTAVFLPYIIGLGDQFGFNEVCTRCGNDDGVFIKTGYNVQTVEKLCNNCLDSYHNVRRSVIQHTANYPSTASSIYSLLLADEQYGVLNENQLISLALEYPDFSEQILASRNSTDAVRSALALSRKQKSNYV
jgi:hypothetical protein